MIALVIHTADVLGKNLVFLLLVQFIIVMGQGVVMYCFSHASASSLLAKETKNFNKD